MNKYKKLFIVLGLLLLVSLLLLIGFPHLIDLFPELSKRFSTEIQIIEVISIVLTIIFTLHELIDTKEISRATFIMELNRSYVENKSCMKIYKVLQKRYDDILAGETSFEDTTYEKQIEKGDISIYLTFFETIYILKKRGAISFDIIDDLFAYRFFFAIHSELFQRTKLKVQPENFKNIFKLEREWLAYRVKEGKTDKKVLEKCCVAQKTEEDRPAFSWDNIFEVNLLRDIVNKDVYERLLN